MTPRWYTRLQRWHCHSQRRGWEGGGDSSRFVFARSTDAVRFGGGAGGMIGSLGEKGEGGIARLEDRKGAGLIVRLRGMSGTVVVSLVFYLVRSTKACFVL